ncbi:unnamed protein product, partial [Brachionus calyciflorus]
MLTIIQLELNMLHQIISYDPEDTFKSVLRKCDFNSSIHSHHASVNNTVILDWNLPMETCSFFGSTIFLHKFRHADNLKNKIFIRLVNDVEANKLISLKIDLTHSIFDLKNLIYRHTSIEPIDQSLNYENRILDDIDKKLCEYGIKNDSVILVKKKTRGGLSIGCSVFADMTQGGCRIKLTKVGKNWRRVTNGLNLLAICENFDCKAHKDLVVVQRGYTLFDFNRIRFVECPECDEQ